MSFQYYTKSLEELQSTSRVIVENFSELIGCRDESITWSPPVAYNVCNSLNISGLSCSEVASQYYEDNTGVLKFSFDSDINSEMKSIWTKVLNFDESVLDVSNISTSKISTKLSTTNKLKISSNQSTLYNSTIYSSAINNPKVGFTQDLKRIYWILLACYTIRYYLYEFSTGNSDTLSSETFSDVYLTKIIKNIEYEKYSLSEFATTMEDYEFSTDFISEQLSLLLKNCKQLKTYVLSYIN